MNQKNINKKNINKKNINMKKVIKLTENELVFLIKKVLNEQTPPIMGLGRAGLNVAKSLPQRGGTLPKPGAPDGPDVSECDFKNVKNVFNFCKQNKNNPSYSPDQQSKRIANTLYKNMKGLSLGINTIKTIDSISDSTQFCKVFNSFNYQNQTLDNWLLDEYSIKFDDLSQKLKKFFTQMGIKDACDNRPMV